MSVYVHPHWERRYERERDMSVYVPHERGEKCVRRRER